MKYSYKIVPIIAVALFISSFSPFYNDSFNVSAESVHSDVAYKSKNTDSQKVYPSLKTSSFVKIIHPQYSAYSTGNDIPSNQNVEDTNMNPQYKSITVLENVNTYFNFTIDVNGQTFVSPVDENPIAVSSVFGPRHINVIGASTFHRGIDIPVAIGTPVRSISYGKVIDTGSKPGMGNYVDVVHNVNGQFFVSHYQHLSKISSNIGEIVQPGTVIAYSGNTGTSGGPHLHFSMCAGTTLNYENTFDPEPFLKLFNISFR